MSEAVVKKSVNYKKIGLILGIVFAVLLVVYFGVSMYFKSHFFFRSTLNGVNSSGVTVDTVMKKIESKADNYALSIEGTNKKEQIKPNQIDMEVANSKSEFEKALKEQNEFAWIGALFSPRHYESKVVVNYDDTKLDERISNLSDVKNESPVKTENAKVDYTKDGFVVKKEVYGTEVDMDTLKKVISSKIMTLDPKVNLKAEKCYVQPTLKADNSSLKDSAEELNKKIKVSITYTVGGATEKISKDTLASFMTNNDKGEVSYNNETIAEFVAEMAHKYDTAGKPKTLTTYTGAVVTVPGGSYGWKIDKDKEAAQLKEDIDAGKDVKRDFIYAKTAASRGENDYGNSYIEVNRTGQYMVVHKDGAVVLQSKVVTGKDNPKNMTHPGAYYVVGKKQNATLKGPTWNSKVSYWMPFNGGEGLHDAVWQPSFGGTYYKIRGSHGCVNLPLNVAGSLYNIVSAGYPVLIYDLPGSEDNEPNQKDAQAIIDAINAIGEVTPASQATIEDIRKRTFRLTPEANAMITNIQVLNDAEANLKNQLAAQGVDWNPPTKAEKSEE
ncbi:MAG: L,D-transpeptidase/peptidoglycan binding protein [Lachnospiraceae bacterium]|nr:L,D-transpeptidase/peptidoglycan binding protein [Lachnospiraceae bacterium]